MELQERILHTADELFRKYGVRSVTMDDLAKHLSISKKTLYQFYTDKDELVLKITGATIRRIDRDMEMIRTESVNALDETVRILNYMRGLISSFQPTFLYDLQKYYPKAYKTFAEYRERNMKNSILFNIRRGIKEGVYRKDVSPEIVARLRLQQIEGCMNPEMFPPSMFNMSDVAHQSLALFLHGLVTEKGYKMLEQYLKKKTLALNPLSI
jgi:TetR/AcrR family transcriptional regulator, cholesterol catabolism regulator